ncbi:hypothetical protein NIT7321_00969 [Phaeobacter italicus]|uniref:Uncharacterized protein n=1 Tax=Phaeobacter italicus TaxID=481446 RepID=A0A0H5CZ26_9RHOB|nr:hypothetical protein [Phaeobacter italicus]CRL10126.1 hypothetical protein NIT7321_00969 [Phaeobacter italicus]
MNITLTPAVRELLEFLCVHNEALQNAAFLLGGAPGLRRTQSLIDRLTSTRQLSRKARQELVGLYQLLSLENVGYPDTIETACFAILDPEDPIVEDLCLLTDNLRDHMDAVEAEAILPVFHFGIAA